MVNQSLLFKQLRDRNLPPIFTRLLIVMYISQTAKVKWENHLSDSFSVTNGVKQGAVLLAISFCKYIFFPYGFFLLEKYIQNHGLAWKFSQDHDNPEIYNTKIQ